MSIDLPKAEILWMKLFMMSFWMGVDVATDDNDDVYDADAEEDADEY